MFTGTLSDTSRCLGSWYRKPPAAWLATCVTASRSVVNSVDHSMPSASRQTARQAYGRTSVTAPSKPVLTSAGRHTSPAECRAQQRLARPGREHEREAAFRPTVQLDH